MVAELGSKHSHKPAQTVTVRATVIRDGTLGISLSLGGELIGEWSDSRARILSLTDDCKVRIQGADGELLYLFSMPGKVVSGEEVSAMEVAITFEL